MSMITALSLATTVLLGTLLYELLIDLSRNILSCRHPHPSAARSCVSAPQTSQQFKTICSWKQHHVSAGYEARLISLHILPSIADSSNASRSYLLVPKVPTLHRFTIHKGHKQFCRRAALVNVIVMGS